MKQFGRKKKKRRLGEKGLAPTSLPSKSEYTEHWTINYFGMDTLDLSCVFYGKLKMVMRSVCCMRQSVLKPEKMFCKVNPSIHSCHGRGRI